MALGCCKSSLPTQCGGALRNCCPPATLRHSRQCGVSPAHSPIACPTRAIQRGMPHTFCRHCTAVAHALFCYMCFNRMPYRGTESWRRVSGGAHTYVTCAAHVNSPGAKGRHQPDMVAWQWQLRDTGPPLHVCTAPTQCETGRQTGPPCGSEVREGCTNCREETAAMHHTLPGALLHLLRRSPDFGSPEGHTSYWDTTDCVTHDLSKGRKATFPPPAP